MRVTKERPRPKRPPLDLSARMAVCDANYLRLLKLVPDCAVGTTHTILLPAVSDAGRGEHRLSLQAVETFRYTTTLLLSLEMTEPVPSWYHSPRLAVRLYHDAATAEVVSYQDQRGFKAVYDDDEMPRYSWDEKNQINLFLADWLSLCLQSGLANMALPECLRAAVVDNEVSALPVQGD